MATPSPSRRGGDCARRDAHSILERCELICPDLPKVFQVPAMGFIDIVDELDACEGRR